LRGGANTVSISRRRYQDERHAKEPCGWEQVVAASYKAKAWRNELYPNSLERGVSSRRTPYNMFVNRAHKFGFCGIEKVGISLWTRIFSRMYHNVTSQEQLAALPSHSVKPRGDVQGTVRGYGFPEHRRMGFAKQDSVYGNPDWYLATFVRDPLERLVSGYLDKCVDARKRVGEKHCDPAEIFANLTQDQIASTHGFKMFVDNLDRNTNVHFQPQAHYCLLGNLPRELRWYRFVGVMNATYIQQVRQLQEDAGFSHIYIDDLLDHPVNKNIRHRSANNGNSNSTIGLLEELFRKYYTSDIASTALAHFAVDYIELGLPMPIFLQDLIVPQQTFACATAEWSQ